MEKIEKVEATHYRIPLPYVMTDSTPLRHDPF